MPDKPAMPDPEWPTRSPVPDALPPIPWTPVTDVPPLPRARAVPPEFPLPSPGAGAEPTASTGLSRASTPPAAEHPDPAAETVPFIAPSDYEHALERVIALAKIELIVFDRDLKEGGWGSRARTDVLREFLLGRTTVRLQIVVHETAWAEGHLPRLTQLLRDFAHKFTILRTVDDARTVSDAFLVADARHVVQRFHQDGFRGELALQSPVKARQLHDRFDSILSFTAPGINATLTGL